MTALRVLLSRIVDVVLRRRRDARLDEEIRTHLELLTDDYVARGWSRSDAAREARRTFGGVDSTKEAVRERRGLPPLDTWLGDLRFALRLVHRDRGFSITAVVVLALGIGVNNMLFAILNAHTLRGLPLPGADRVVSVSTLNDRNQDRGLSRPEFEDLRTSTRSFTTILAIAQKPVIVSGDGRSAERLDGAFLSGRVSAVTGQVALIGRALEPDDERPGAARIATIGSGLWHARYAGDPSVVGRTILVDEAPATIVGVITDRSGLPVTAAVWLPLSHLPEPGARVRTDRVLTVFAPLGPGVSASEAAAELQVLTERFARDHPAAYPNTRLRLMPINERYFGDWTSPVWLAFMTAGILVVLISAANVANLVLGSVGRRTRELAIRASLGATRRRLVWQLLVEGTLLAALGGMLGLGVAVAGLKLFRSSMPQDALPYWYEYSLDGRVLVALVGVSVGTLFVFALLPALRASRADVQEILKAGGRGADSRVTHRWATAFLAAEVALGMILLAQVVVAFRDRPTPLPSERTIATRQVLTASVTLPAARYATADARLDFYRRLHERLREVPEVESTSLVSVPPLAGGTDVRIDIAGQPAADPTARPAARLVAVSPRYFETLAVPLARGRELDERDAPTAGAPAVIVNQEFVRRHFPGVDPIGRRIAVETPSSAPGSAVESTGGTSSLASTWSTIVGVAPDIRQRPRPGAEPIVYTVYSAADGSPATLLVRSRVEPTDIAARLKSETAALDPGLPLYRVRTLADVVWEATWNGRLSHRLILSLTLIAVALAGVGLYAVSTQAVGRRTQEIGVRIALGAGPRTVAALILRRALTQLAAGLLAGTACIRIWQALLPGSSGDVSPTDAVTLSIVAGVLVLITVLACAAPVRRAIRLDPVAAIRPD